MSEREVAGHAPDQDGDEADADRPRRIGTVRAGHHLDVLGHTVVVTADGRADNADETPLETPQPGVGGGAIGRDPES